MLIELSSQARRRLRDGAMEEILSEGVERGLVADAAFAESLDQAKAFWRIREMFGEVQRQVGGSIKHDVSVPVAHVPAFIREANAAVIKLIPGARPLPFGHLGDGNIHYNISAAGRRRQSGVPRRWHDVNDVVFEVVLEVRRLDLGRARHRHHEARPAADHQGPGRDGIDAHAQAHARSERDFESGQGACSSSPSSRGAPEGRVSKHGPTTECPPHPFEIARRFALRMRPSRA